MSDLMQPYNERNKKMKELTRRPKKKDDVPVDMEHMYQRPQPDVFSKDWNDGYNDGWDNRPFEVRNMNYADGYRTGEIAVVEDKKDLDRMGSSNA